SLPLNRHGPRCQNAQLSPQILGQRETELGADSDQAHRPPRAYGIKCALVCRRRARRLKRDARAFTASDFMNGFGDAPVARIDNRVRTKRFRRVASAFVNIECNHTGSLRLREKREAWRKDPPAPDRILRRYPGR